jgi:hypothetical protein
MSEERTVKPFRLASGVPRDKDNAMPREPRPQFLANDHPRLAPPGMSGVRSAERLGLQRAMAPPAREKRPRAVFKSLVRSERSPGRDR